MSRFLSIILLLCVSAATAQDAMIIREQQPNGTYTYRGYVYTSNGILVLNKIEIHERNPTPPPVTVGKRDIAIIYESGLVGERQASLHVLLQTNPTFRTWVKQQGHRVLILDQNGKDEKGNPSPVVQRFTKAFKSGQRIPALVILDQSSDSALFVGDVLDSGGKLLPNMTVDGITELIKKHGG